MDVNKIYNMDALIGLCQIENSSVDLILTDPPYNVIEEEWDKFDETDFLLFTEMWLYQCHRISRGAFLLMFWSQKLLYLTNKLNTKWKRKRVLIWYIPNSNSRAEDGFYYRYQPLILMEKEGEKKISKKRDDLCCDVIMQSFVGDNYAHPTIKPLPLIKGLIKKYSFENDVVLDCFMGSGTTAVACKLLNRRYIGFEKEKKYWDICQERLNKTTRERDLNDFE